MKRNINHRAIADLAAMPVAQIVLGLILLLNPDGVVSVICKILGWLMVAAALYFAFSMVKTARNRDAGTVILALGFGGCGAFLIKNPLILAVGTGKIIGILLAIRGVSGLIQAGKDRENGGSYILSYLGGAVSTILGIWLVLSPMAPSRLIFGLIGIALIVVAAVKLLGLKQDFAALVEPRDPNIIDADE